MQKVKEKAMARVILPALFAALVSAPLTAPAQTRVFAPYIDISLSNNNLAQISQASGIKVFTLAFIVGNGCSNSWFGVVPVSSDTTYKPLIDALRSAGGDVIISFGGASGVELAGTCTSVSNIQSQYQAVINKYGVKMLDFDIEGAAVADTGAIDRRNQALAALEKANSGLVISYTLPVLPTGLDQYGINLLTNAKSHGVNVAVVNIMTMDYGGGFPANAMGQNAINAANATISQLQSIGLNAKVGITPMIGMNDTSPEIFTLSDAQKVLSYAKSNSSINRLAFWSVARDQSCPGGGTYVSDSCSGISQSTWAFSHVFEGFSGSSGGGGGGTPQVANLSFNPGGGSYSSAQNVTISTSTGGATIRYTTDGSTPSETHGTVYSGPVNISGTATLKAIGYESGYTDSNITSATYTISTGGGGGGGSSTSFEAESLSYTPSGATASVQTDTNSSGGHWVMLSGNSVGDYITFTTPSIPAGTYQLQMEWKGLTSRGILQLSVDGSNVGGTLDQYSASATYPTTTFGTVTFGSTGTHTIRLTVTGKNSASSNYQLSADKFTFVASSGGGGGGGSVSAPAFNPGGGTYSTALNVTVTSGTGGATIRYTIDGSTPTETHGTIYSSPVSISSTITLKAIAYESGMTDSAVTSATYTISTGGGGGSTLNFEAESLSYTPSGATASVQTDANSSGGKWVELSGNSVGDYITFTVPNVPAGTYQLKMEWKGLTSRGILQLSVDGSNVGGTLDQYATGQTYPTTTFGNVSFGSAGNHTIRLTVTGKNSASSNYQLSADKFTFVGQ